MKNCPSCSKGIKCFPMYYRNLVQIPNISIKLRKVMGSTVDSSPQGERWVFKIL